MEFKESFTGLSNRLTCRSNYTKGICYVRRVHSCYFV